MTTQIMYIIITVPDMTPFLRNLPKSFLRLMRAGTGWNARLCLL